MKMKKRVLCIATVASMLDNFNRSNVDILLDMGYDVTLAANFQSMEDINSQKKTDDFVREMRAKGIHIVHIEFSRRLKNARMHAAAVVQVNRLLKRHYDLIHCHSPICAAIVRLLACTYRKEYGTKVFYTAHGFHFYKGAPLISWLLYYPAELALSQVTDVLITINREDYKRAVQKLHAKKTVYIPGIGVDIKKFVSVKTKTEEKRRSLGLKKDDILLLSAGELNRNKNHKAVILALEKILKSGCIISSRLHYCIAGMGELHGELVDLAEKTGVNLQLLGFRNDMADIMKAADIFIHPSKREGLPVALMEAMAAGLPSVVTDIRGNTDLIRNGREGYVCSSGGEKLENAILALAKNRKLREHMGHSARIRIQKFDEEIVERKLLELYSQAFQ